MPDIRFLPQRKIYIMSSHPPQVGKQAFLQLLCCHPAGIYAVVYKAVTTTA
jgi:hypothetical protein